jgi:hypothetical protein
MTDPALLSHETGPYLRPLRGEPVFIRVVKPGSSSVENHCGRAWDRRGKTRFARDVVAERSGRFEERPEFESGIAQLQTC